MASNVFLDITGQRFGRLLVISRALNNAHGQASWNCACDCGGAAVTTGTKLRSGHTTSCGCASRDGARVKATTHGQSKSPLYAVWTAMKSRCYRSGDKSFADYGGRGITVCAEWREDFAAFLSWAAASGYRRGVMIDRENNDGDYCPDNCRWVTRMVQNANKRNSLRRADGELWLNVARANGVPHWAFYARVRMGWDLGRASSQPSRKTRT